MCILCTVTFFWQWTPFHFVVINATFSASKFCPDHLLTFAAHLCTPVCIFNWIPFGLTELFIWKTVLIWPANINSFCKVKPIAVITLLWPCYQLVTVQIMLSNPFPKLFIFSSLVLTASSSTHASSKADCQFPVPLELPHPIPGKISICLTSLQ